MIWFLATIVLIVALMTQRSKPVRAVLVAALLGVLATGIYFRLQTPPATVQRAPAAPSRAVSTLPPEAIRASGLEMSGTGAPWYLKGTVTNQSSRELLSFTIAVTRLDCYEGALDASGCVTLWEGEQLVSLTVPAHATRNFAVAIRPHNALAPKGQTRDTFEIKSAVGR